MLLVRGVPRAPPRRRRRCRRSAELGEDLVRQVPHALVDVVRRLRGSVNLLRWNEVDGLPFQRPTDEAVIRFQRVLKQNNINAIIRKSRGRDIAAACGQLKHESKHSA